MSEQLSDVPGGGALPARWKRSGPWHAVVAAVNVVPDLVLAGAFLVTWIAPFALGIDSVKHYLLLVLLEFIVIHSAAFMGNAAMATSRPTKRVLSTLGFGVFYSLFAGGFSAAFKTWWPLIAFWGLTLNRLVSYVAARTLSPDDQKAVQQSWGLSAALYLGAVFLTLFTPVPSFGITKEVLPALHLPGSGLWIEQPGRAMAVGVIYFGGQAAFEIVMAIRNWQRARALRNWN